MRSDLRSYDVAIIGAGPVGCATALAYAARGAEVLLLEANPKAAGRLAGEWLHPPAVQILERLGVELEPSVPYPTGRGFVVFPDDGSRPIVLPYESGRFGHSLHHETLVETLRKHATMHPNVAYVESAKATRIVGQNLTYQLRGGATRTVFADQIVGASGRSSVAHAALGISSNAGTYSRMAGLVLEGSELPFEGYGHVCLGALGPILIYRISAREVRVCMDVPLSLRTTREKEAVLYESYAPALPDVLRAPFRKALVSGELAWATNQTRSRVLFGRPGLALVGDAVGHHHPLTALGMTLGFQDAVGLAAAPSFAAYRRERTQESRVPEMLAIALYEVFADSAEEVIAIRRAVYELWRRSPAERLRTMRYLACEETRPAVFGASFLRALGVASKNLAVHGASTSQWSHVRGITEELGSRIRWLMTGALHLTEARPSKELPRGADDRYAGALRASAAKADVVELPSAAGHAARTGQDRWDPSQALERAARSLVALQDDDGSFEGECVSSPVLAAEHVLARHVMGLAVEPARAKRILLHFERTRTDDGRWGDGAEPSLLATALVYVAARVLGAAADDPLLERARTYFVREGGVVRVTGPGKVWLAMLGVYGWDGVAAPAPGLWALPRALPGHPAGDEAHARRTRAALSLLAEGRFQAPADEIVAALRGELFPQGFENVDFSLARALEVPQEIERIAATLSTSRTRRRVTTRMREALRDELRRADHVSLSPSIALLEALALWVHDPSDPDAARVVERSEGWIWEDDRDGARLAAARTPLRDSALGARALVAASPNVDVGAALASVDAFLARDWAPATAPSDWLAEALLARLEADVGGGPSDGDVVAVAALLLSRRGADGGFGRYEPSRRPRSPREWTTPGDRCDAECTATCIAALAEVKKRRPLLLRRPELAALEAAALQGAAHVRRSQLPEGPWASTSGVRLVRGTYLAVRGLVAGGVPPIDPSIRKACAWLKAHQRPDGSWGERHAPATTGYVEHDEGQVVQTAWALLALLHAQEPEWEVIERAARFLVREQLGSGEWPRQARAGLSESGMLVEHVLDRWTYPVWALALFEARRSERAQLIEEAKRQVAAE